MIKKISFLILLLSITLNTFAQENIRPCKTNTAIGKNAKSYSTKNTRALNLPFIEDFSYKGPYADATKWAKNKQVYINNTFGVDMISQGVATFDQLNENGQSYHPNGVPSAFFADTLMSAAIDLSASQASDSIYFSFFVQPQGNGFRPEPSDSLQLFWKDNNGNWIKVWGQGGSTLLPFRQYILPVTNSIFHHSTFQFRFINFASPNTNDDNWNLDYIRLDKNRTAGDTVLNDLAFSKAPTFITSNYTSLPYRHFIIDTINEQSQTFQSFLKNNYKVGQTVGVNLISKESIGNATLKTDNVTLTIPSNLELNALYNKYNITYTPPNINQDITIKHTYFYNKLNALENAQNDTIVRENIFGQYFAYDDASAEKEYYLLPALNFAASTALKFHLNMADTLRGLAIKFGNQIPSAIGKKFTIVVYQTLGANSSSQQVIYKQDFNTVQFEDGTENFTTYLLDTVLPLNAGTYYIGTTQAPNTGIDTLYFGLDANNISNPDHFFFNVDGNWAPSIVDGATMFRPLVGPIFTPTGINSVAINKVQVIAYPNPTTDILFLKNNATAFQYAIINTAGSKIKSAYIKNNFIDVQDLVPGHYRLLLYNNKNEIVDHITFIKQ